MLKIKEKIIGEDNPVFIIAEAGINHNGRLEIAKKLVDVAVNAGADAVKFQTFKPYEIKNLNNITYDETVILKKYCDARNIIFFSTPHSLSAIDFLNDIVPAYKIASPYITHDYFIKRIKMKNKPVIASFGSIIHPNGMSTQHEITRFLSILNQNLALLYCVSKYPCYNFSEEDFVSFKSQYGKYPVGYSSHTKDISYSMMAVELGAQLIEQHITIANDFNCPDKDVSLNQDELTDLVTQIRLYEEEQK